MYPILLDRLDIQFYDFLFNQLCDFFSKALSVASVPEFVPRGIPTITYSKNMNEPEIAEILQAESPTLTGELINAYNNPSVDNELQAAANVTTYQV